MYSEYQGTTGSQIPGEYSICIYNDIHSDYEIYTFIVNTISRYFTKNGILFRPQHRSCSYQNILPVRIYSFSLNIPHTHRPIITLIRLIHPKYRVKNNFEAISKEKGSHNIKIK